MGLSVRGSYANFFIYRCYHLPSIHCAHFLSLNIFINIGTANVLVIILLFTASMIDVIIIIMIIIISIVITVVIILLSLVLQSHCHH